jgi:hypothetical protein
MRNISLDTSNLSQQDKNRLQSYLAQLFGWDGELTIKVYSVSLHGNPFATAEETGESFIGDITVQLIISK